MTDAPVPDDERGHSFHRIAKVLNSPFLIFVLSSVVVTLVSRCYADRQAFNERATKQAVEYSHLMTELALRVHDIDARMNDLSVAVGQRRGADAMATSGCGSISLSNAPYTPIPLDLQRDAELRAFNALQAAVAGTPPYAASGPEYTNVHLIRVISELDANRSDNIGAQRLLWTVPRQARQWPPFVTLDSAMNLNEPEICQLMRFSRNVEIYYNIRRNGGCESSARSSGDLVCHGVPSGPGPRDFGLN